MKSVTILGCGPAGLLAAQGAGDAGAKVTIVSRKQKSNIFGAQYLHVPYPGLEVKHEGVHIIKRGDAEGYGRKVYNDPNRQTSWYNFEDGEMIPAWPMREIYDQLWDRWEDRIVDQELTPQRLDWLEMGGSDLLVSTIPAPALCSVDYHNFDSSSVLVSSSRCQVNRNSIIYNGISKTPWYRASFLFGVMSTEYGSFRTQWTKSPPGDAVEIKKPQWTDCDCREQWKRVGRYGRWQRGVLAHTAYEEVYHVLTDAVHKLS
jgi:hypothetical protein